MGESWAVVVSLMASEWREVRKRKAEAGRMKGLCCDVETTLRCIAL